MASLPYNIETNLTYRAILMARTAFTDVATGKRIMVLVCSDPGFGKTLEAKRALRLANVPFDATGSIATEQDFVRYMWKIESGIICHKGRRIRVLLVDDNDGLFRRATIANYLKAAFGADRRRIQATSNEISLNEDYRNSDNEEERKKYKAIIPAKSFDVRVGMIGLANIDYTDPDVVAGLQHFAALVSKGLDPLRIPNDAENGGRDVFTYTHYLATVQNSLGGEGYTYEVARAAVEFYVRNVHHLIDIPPRRLSMIAKVIKDNPDLAGRQERLNAMLRATDQRPKLKIPEEWIPLLLWPNDPPRRPDPQPDPDPPPAASQPIPPVAPDPLHTDPAAPKLVDEPVDTDPSAPNRVDDPPPAASAPTPINPERAPSVQEPPVEYELPYVVEGICVGKLDAILNMILPPGDSRQGAFLGAVEQAKAMGKNVDEPVLEFIRRMAIKPDRASKLFEPDTAGEIINQARAMMAWFGPIGSVRDPDPSPTIHQVANALSDEETAEITRRYDLRAFPGRAGELDVVAYHRRAAFLKIAGPRLTRDQVAVVRRKSKSFWRAMGLAEDLLAEMLNLLARGDGP